MFEHNFDTFSVYTKTQIVDKQLSPPPHKVKAPYKVPHFTLIPLDNYKTNENPLARWLTGFRYLHKNYFSQQNNTLSACQIIS